MGLFAASAIRKLCAVLALSAGLNASSAIARAPNHRSVDFVGRLSYLALFVERAALSQFAEAPLDGGVSSPRCLESASFVNDLFYDNTIGRMSLRASEHSRMVVRNPTPVWVYKCRFISNGPHSVVRDANPTIVLFSLRVPNIIDPFVLKQTIERALADDMMLPESLKISEARALHQYNTINQESRGGPPIYLFTYPSLENMSSRGNRQLAMKDWIVGIEIRLHGENTQYFDLEFKALD